MKHIIYTRCNFNDTDLFYKYFEVMKKWFIPSVKDQTCKNFKLFIYVNKNIPEHSNVIKKEFEGSDVDYILEMPGFKTKLIEDKYLLQTRHDCDDYMAPNYVQKLQEMYKEHIDAHNEFLIHAQPTKLDFNTGEEYMGRIYSDKSTSMFLTLCQREVTKNIIQEKHGQFPNIVSKVFSLDVGYVKLVIHDNNKASKIKPTDVKIIKNEQS